MTQERIKYSSLLNKSELDEPRNVRPWHGCGYRCAKTFVIIFHIFFWVLGWTFIGLGISLRDRWAGSNVYTEARQFTSSDVVEKDHGSYNSAAEHCLIVGCMTVFVVLLACCGAHTENQYMLGTYIGVVVIMLCFEIGAIAVTGLYREEVEQRIIKDVKFTMDVYEEHNFEAITSCIDEFQKTFHCCGCINYQDWYNSSWGKRHRGNVPSSCLKNDSFLETLHQRRLNTTLTIFSINTTGCFGIIRDYFVKNLYFIGTFIAWVIGIQVIALFFAVYLFYKVRNRETEIASRYGSIQMDSQQ